MENVEYRIGPVQAAFMIAVALLIDLIQYILTILIFTAILCPLISLMAIGLFAMWFKINKVDAILSYRIGPRFVGSAFLELIPILDGFPIWTIGIWLTIRASRKLNQERAG